MAKIDIDEVRRRYEHLGLHYPATTDQGWWLLICELTDRIQGLEQAVGNVLSLIPEGKDAIYADPLAWLYSVQEVLQEVQR